MDIIGNNDDKYIGITQNEVTDILSKVKGLDNIDELSKAIYEIITKNNEKISNKPRVIDEGTF
jgi:uncharacterized protein YunC (DUF1805 family)